MSDRAFLAHATGVWCLFPCLQLLPRIKEIGGDPNQLVRSALATVVMELAPILGKVLLVVQALAVACMGLPAPVKLSCISGCST